VIKLGDNKNMKLGDGENKSELSSCVKQSEDEKLRISYLMNKDDHIIGGMTYGGTMFASTMRHNKHNEDKKIAKKIDKRIVGLKKMLQQFLEIKDPEAYLDYLKKTVDKTKSDADKVLTDKMWRKISEGDGATLPRYIQLFFYWITTCLGLDKKFFTQDTQDTKEEYGLVIPKSSFAAIINKIHSIVYVGTQGQLHPIFEKIFNEFAKYPGHNELLNAIYKVQKPIDTEDDDALEKATAKKRVLERELKSYGVNEAKGVIDSWQKKIDEIKYMTVDKDGRITLKDSLGGRGKTYGAVVPLFICWVDDKVKGKDKGRAISKLLLERCELCDDDYVFAATLKKGDKIKENKDIWKKIGEIFSADIKADVLKIILSKFTCVRGENDYTPMAHEFKELLLKYGRDHNTFSVDDYELFVQQLDNQLGKEPKLEKIMDSSRWCAPYITVLWLLNPGLIEAVDPTSASVTKVIRKGITKDFAVCKALLQKMFEANKCKLIENKVKSSSEQVVDEERSRQQPKPKFLWKSWSNDSKNKRKRKRDDSDIVVIKKKV
jgi:hypothetical protein